MIQLNQHTPMKVQQVVKIYGDHQGDRTGSSLSNAGDVNQDGYPDIIVGANFAANGDGIAYVIFGKKDGFSDIKLGNLTTSGDGFKILGEFKSTAGYSVSSAGDINGDGYDDMIVGALHNDDRKGVAYVIFGKKQGEQSSDIDLANNFTSTDGFKIFCDAHCGIGYSVSSAGDINNDGVSDIIVGAPIQNNIAGVAYVIFGKKQGEKFSDIDLANNFTSKDGFKILGEPEVGYTGWSVSSAGDINNDGINDIIIGAQGGVESLLPGRAYVIFGRKQGEKFSDIDLVNLAPTDGFRILGALQHDQTGCSVSSAGDMNGDGIGDIIIGTCAYDYRSRTGAAYVIFGKKQGEKFSDINLVNDLAPTNGFKISGESDSAAGQSVSSAGDINGDGHDDVVVCAPGYDGSSRIRAVYIIFGKKSGENFHNINLSELTPGDGFKMLAGGLDDISITSASSVWGKKSADGYLILGAPFTNSNAGTVYLYSYSGLIKAPICHDTQTFQIEIAASVQINLTQYLNTANIKLYTLPTLGKLSEKNSNPAEKYATYGVNVLQYKAGNTAGDDNFKYTAIDDSKSVESSQCTTNIMVSLLPITPTCSTASFSVMVSSSVGIDFTQYINTANVKLYGLPTLGKLLKGASAAAVGDICAIDELKYQAGSNAGHDNFNYTAIDLKNLKESLQCTTNITISASPVTPTCSTASFSVGTGSIVGIDFSKDKYINTANIKLYNLPTLGNLSEKNSNPAEKYATYGINALQYKAGNSTGSDNFKYTAIDDSKSAESSQCSASITISTPPISKSFSLSATKDYDYNFFDFNANDRVTDMQDHLDQLKIKITQEPGSCAKLYDSNGTIIKVDKLFDASQKFQYKFTGCTAPATDVFYYIAVNSHALPSSESKVDVTISQTSSWWGGWLSILALSATVAGGLTTLILGLYACKKKKICCWKEAVAIEVAESMINTTITTIDSKVISKPSRIAHNDDLYALDYDNLCFYGPLYWLGKMQCNIFDPTPD